MELWFKKAMQSLVIAGCWIGIFLWILYFLTVCSLGFIVFGGAAFISEQLSKFNKYIFDESTS